VKIALSYLSENWGAALTTQLGLGIGIELCFNLPPKSGASCDANDDANGNYPDNYTAGLGENLGVKFNVNGSFCINFGPSVGLPGGAGWDL
jgi:hypothetical protein